MDVDDRACGIHVNEDSMTFEDIAQPVEPCMCGHAKAAHEHYRAGSDCALCTKDGCQKFRAATELAVENTPVNPAAHA
jgi:hypothetical protein